MRVSIVLSDLICLNCDVLRDTCLRLFQSLFFLPCFRMDRGQWSNNSRKNYNLLDAVPRCTVQVRFEIQKRKIVKPKPFNIFY